MTKKDLLTLFLIIFCIVAITHQAGAEQTVTESEGVSAVQDTGSDAEAEAQEEANEALADGKYINNLPSAEAEVKIPLNESLNAFLSFGAPTLKEIDGREDNTNYRAVLGLHIAL